MAVPMYYWDSLIVAASLHTPQGGTEVYVGNAAHEYEKAKLNSP